MGYEPVDFGTFSPESIDYPDVAHPLAAAVEKGDPAIGIAMCGTGNGMAITLKQTSEDTWPGLPGTGKSGNWSSAQQR